MGGRAREGRQGGRRKREEDKENEEQADGEVKGRETEEGTDQKRGNGQ